MISIKFIVEGNADALFIRAFLKQHFKVDFKDNSFIKVDGCTKELLFSENNIELLNKNSEKEGGFNLLIFDADQPDFEKTKQNLELWKSEMNVQYEIFIFPNNKDSGNLETLLFNIANLENSNKEILNCFENYKLCIGGLNKNFSLPDEHAKFYAFEESVLSKSKFKEVHSKPEKYLLKEVYNIESPHLNPLKDFLSKYF